MILNPLTERVLEYLRIGLTAGRGLHVLALVCAIAAPVPTQSAWRALAVMIWFWAGSSRAAILLMVFCGVTADFSFLSETGWPGRLTIKVSSPETVRTIITR